VDARVLPATCALASEQTSPTTATIARLDRLLGYAAAHPNGQKVFRASAMILRVLSDATLSRRPRPIFCDNEVAIGLATDGINLCLEKKSEHFSRKCYTFKKVP
jgi:hypothetical protein